VQFVIRTIRANETAEEDTLVTGFATDNIGQSSLNSDQRDCDPATAEIGPNAVTGVSGLAWWGMHRTGARVICDGPDRAGRHYARRDCLSG
jgi:hypothetical protein